MHRLKKLRKWTQQSPVYKLPLENDKSQTLSEAYEAGELTKFNLPTDLRQREQTTTQIK